MGALLRAGYVTLGETSLVSVGVIVCGVAGGKGNSPVVGPGTLHLHGPPCDNDRVGL